METKSSIVTLAPGLYILRHPKDGLSPLSISRAPGATTNSGTFKILSTRGTHGAILRDSADCIVILIEDVPVELLVTAYLDHAGAEIPALKIDKVSLNTKETLAAMQASTKCAQIEISSRGLSIIGHIERTGDVVASEGQNLGNIAGDLRLEGFQIMWPDRPEGIDLEYGISIEGLGAMPFVKTGQFCGTKGEARRITQVTFALTGPLAKQFELDGTAHFSGGFIMPISSGMALSGPSGLEHLTSIRLRAQPRAHLKENASTLWDESPRTKIFKAKALVPATSEKPALKNSRSKAAKPKKP